MKDPNLALLNAYKTALAGLTVSGSAVQVYSKLAPLKNVPKKYVILSSQSRIQNETGCGYWYECTFDVDIVTRYPNGQGDSAFAMLMAEEVQQIIQVDGITVADFNLRQTEQNPTTEIILTTDEENIFRYILTFTHKLNRA